MAPSSPAAVPVLEGTVLPVLNLAKAGVTGIGVPGLEPVVNGVYELANMVAVSHLASRNNPHREFISTDDEGQQERAGRAHQVAECVGCHRCPRRQ